MKIFSFFFKEQVFTEPGKKIISEKDFSILKEADEILEKAKEDAKEYKEKVIQDCEVLKEEAKKEGFEEGLDTFNVHIVKLNKTIKGIQEEVEKKILSLALKAARKIVSEELKLHPDTITEIVKQALRPVIQHHRIKIYVNKQDLDILEENKPKLKEILEQVQTLSIEERSDIEPGGCIIETEAGIINAQLENQFRALEAAFETFLKK